MAISGSTLREEGGAGDQFPLPAVEGTPARNPQEVARQVTSAVLDELRAIQSENGSAAVAQVVDQLRQVDFASLTQAVEAAGKSLNPAPRERKRLVDSQPITPERRVDIIDRQLQTLDTQMGDNFPELKPLLNDVQNYIQVHHEDLQNGEETVWMELSQKTQILDSEAEKIEPNVTREYQRKQWEYEDVREKIPNHYPHEMTIDDAHELNYNVSYETREVLSGLRHYVDVWSSGYDFLLPAQQLKALDGSDTSFRDALQQQWDEQQPRFATGLAEWQKLIEDGNAFFDSYEANMSWNPERASRDLIEALRERQPLVMVLASNVGVNDGTHLSYIQADHPERFQLITQQIRDTWQRMKYDLGGYIQYLRSVNIPEKSSAYWKGIFARYADQTNVAQQRQCQQLISEKAQISARKSSAWQTGREARWLHNSVQSQLNQMQQDKEDQTWHDEQVSLARTDVRTEIARLPDRLSSKLTNPPLSPDSARVVRSIVQVIEEAMSRDEDITPEYLETVQQAVTQQLSRLQNRQNDRVENIQNAVDSQRSELLRRFDLGATPMPEGYIDQARLLPPTPQELQGAIATQLREQQLQEQVTLRQTLVDGVTTALEQLRAFPQPNEDLTALIAAWTLRQEAYQQEIGAIQSEQQRLKTETEQQQLWDQLLQQIDQVTDLDQLQILLFSKTRFFIGNRQNQVSSDQTVVSNLAKMVREGKKDGIPWWEHSSNATYRYDLPTHRQLFIPQASVKVEAFLPPVPERYGEVRAQRDRLLKARNFAEFRTALSSFHSYPVETVNQALGIEKLGLKAFHRSIAEAFRPMTWPKEWLGQAPTVAEIQQDFADRYGCTNVDVNRLVAKFVQMEIVNQKEKIEEILSGGFLNLQQASDTLNETPQLSLHHGREEVFTPITKTIEVIDLARTKPDHFLKKKVIFNKSAEEVYAQLLAEGVFSRTIAERVTQILLNDQTFRRPR